MTETRITINLSIDFALVFSLAILVQLSLIFTLQPFARLVQNVLQPLVHRRLGIWQAGRLADIWIAVHFQLVNCRLAVKPCVFLHNLLQPLPRIIAAFRVLRIVPVLCPVNDALQPFPYVVRLSPLTPLFPGGRLERYQTGGDTTLPRITLSRVGVPSDVQSLTELAERGARLTGGMNNSAPLCDGDVFPALSGRRFRISNETPLLVVWRLWSGPWG